MLPARHRSLFAILGFVASFFLFAVSASAETLYIDPAGSDSNSGTTPAEAFATIQKGIDTVEAGGTVSVSAGTYTESLLVGKQITIEGSNAGISAGWNAGVRAAEAIIQGQAEALFLPLYTRQVIKEGDGLVTSSPEGIACGLDCADDFQSGEEVTLEASAGEGQEKDMFLLAGVEPAGAWIPLAPS